MSSSSQFQHHVEDRCWYSVGMDAHLGPRLFAVTDHEEDDVGQMNGVKYGPWGGEC